MKGSSFFEKLSQNNFSLVLILLVFIFSAFAVLYLTLEFSPVYFVKATKLDKTPEKYFPYSNLDSYDIQSIFDSGGSIQISSEVFSEISEIQKDYETKNVPYGNEYYELQLVFGDRFSPIPFFFPSFTISGILIVGIFVSKIKSHLIKR